MGYVLLGVFAFVIALSFDFISLKNIPYLKQFIGLIFGAMLFCATIMVAFDPIKLPLAAWLSFVGWPLLSISSLLLVYSIFLEIPFRKTYAEAGVGDELIKTGTYALTRHPGVLWYSLFLMGLILVSRSRSSLWAAPAWLAMEVLWVWIQDRFFFDQMFPGYEQYRQETPMLIPTRKSIKRCLDTLFSEK